MASAAQTANFIADQKDKPRFLVSDLCIYLEKYLPPEQIREVYRAYLFSAEAHEGQHRQSGEPYIYHPVAVACILAEMRMDYKCLMAAILHDVIEDTHTAKETLAVEFDKEIAELVDGVSKLTQIDFKCHAEAQAANMRKMLLAMTKDIRVILIKLADRLHNMRTLGALRPDKSRRISKETLEIYAPIANRLGINTMRLELEELGFSHYWPWRFRCLADAVSRARGARRELVANVEKAIEMRMAEAGLVGRVVGRQKHLYSIYCKMVQKKLSFSDIVDVYAFRIIVDALDTCYRMLGMVHNLYKPVPGKFKDYIAIPKSNGYQSLHTVLFGPNGVPIEIQIRTEDMHRMAESGIAAHWVYKTANGEVGGAHARASDWLQNLLEMQKGAGDSIEFLENVKIDLFPDEVYVFTPKGQILVLPRGATAVDFAYAIHSDIGNSSVAARIDRRLAPLATRIFSGQTVEVITAPGAKPNPAWLNFVVTGKARANVRGYLKHLQTCEAEKLGRRMLQEALAVYGVSLDSLDLDVLQPFLVEAGVDNLAGLLRQIGLGNRMPKLVAHRLAGDEFAQTDDNGMHARPSGQLVIKGTEGMVVAFAKCCRPIPGDPIVGIFSPGRGIVVHCQGCRNLGDFQRLGHNWLDVQWEEEEAEAEFPTEIRLDVGNQRGVLATVAAAISEMGSNIENVRSQDPDGMTSILNLLVSVRGRRHLEQIMRRLRALPVVMRIVRVSH
jgi:guanosine-3',5'-bis(diphosphate) 3'-pyrophosphohydrolase